MSSYCSQCGEQLADDANFCSSCGAAVVAEVSAPESTTASIDVGALDPQHELESMPTVQPGTAMLVVVRGPNAGSRFLLDADVTTIGRHPDSDIFLDDVTVSRRHAEFHLESGAVTVVDNGSLNGSYVNGERVERRVVATGDEVQIGRFKLLFVNGGDDVTGEGA